MVVHTQWGNLQPERPEGGGCVLMREDGTWADAVCTSLNAFICKKTDGRGTTPAQIREWP